MSKKSNATKSILKVAKLAGLNAQIAVLEAHNEQLDEVSSFAEMSEVQLAAEQKNTVLKIVRPNGHQVEMTAGELGYFMWSLLDDLYLVKGMKYIKKAINEGEAPDTKKQMELAGRFLYVLGFETNEIQGAVDQFAKIDSLLSAA